MWFYKPCFCFCFGLVCFFAILKASSFLWLLMYTSPQVPPGKTLRFCWLRLPSLSSPHASTHFTDKTVATGAEKLTLVFIIDTIVIGERQDREEETVPWHISLAWLRGGVSFGHIWEIIMHASLEFLSEFGVTFAMCDFGYWTPLFFCAKGGPWDFRQQKSSFSSCIISPLVALYS